MQTKDLRIETIRPVVPPVVLREECPLNDEGAGFVSAARDSVVKILAGQDDRLLVVVGPCSIHDPQAALDYARRLADLAATLVSDLYIVMRVYFEKPRTTVGWKGLINDPRLDGTFAVNEGIRAARRLLLDLVTLRLPAGCEFLDPISPQFFADIVTWAAIGARTVESQVHRQLASGLSMPVGFKNGTNGNVQVAADAVRAAAHPHSFLGVTEEGLAAIVTTYGNSDCHIILRGGDTGPNFNTEHVKNSLRLLKKNHLLPRLMIDTSHGNSNKDHHQQPLVTESIAQQVAAGEGGIIGLLMESFLVDGRQDLVDGAPLVYGQSITDACMGWEMTVPVLESLARAVQARRRHREAEQPAPQVAAPLIRRA